MLHIPGLYLAQSKDRGRGVFLSQSIEADNLIEICPLLIIPKEQVPLIHKTILHDYYFIFDEKKGSACIPLGYGCLYNHSSDPNARIAYDKSDDCIQVISTRVITSNEEVLIDYMAGDQNKDDLWFEPK